MLSQKAIYPAPRVSEVMCMRSKGYFGIARERVVVWVNIAGVVYTLDSITRKGKACSAKSLFKEIASLPSGRWPSAMESLLLRQDVEAIILKYKGLMHWIDMHRNVLVESIDYDMMTDEVCGAIELPARQAMLLPRPQEPYWDFHARYEALATRRALLVAASLVSIPLSPAHPEGGEKVRAKRSVAPH